MTRKLCYLALLVAAETLLELIYLYYTKTSGPLLFRIRLTPDVDFHT